MVVVLKVVAEGDVETLHLLNKLDIRNDIYDIADNHVDCDVGWLPLNFQTAL